MTARSGFRFAARARVSLRALAASFISALALPAFASATPPPPTLGLHAASADTPARLELAWPADFAAWYRIERSSDLRAWSPADPGPLRADRARMARFFDLAPGTQFFRVREVAPPLGIPSARPYFTTVDPTGTVPDYALEDLVIDLLEQAEPGSTVHGAIYTWTRQRMADAFVAASARGVEVRLIIGSDYAAVRSLQDRLPPGHVITCPGADGLAGSCHGDAINHNKFLLFSFLADGTRDVVVQSSANFTNPQLVSANHLIVFRDHPALYAVHRAYWDDLARQQRELDYTPASASGEGVTVWFSPQRSANASTGVGDPVVAALSDFVAGPGAAIHVAMAFWSDARPAIAHRLVELRRAGAQVRVIVSPSGTGASIFDILETGGVEVTRLEAVHSKYMLVHSMPQRRARRLVYAGSHNYTSPALRSNDESLLRLEDEALYEAFLADWQRLRAHPLAN